MVSIIYKPTLQPLNYLAQRSRGFLELLAGLGAEAGHVFLMKIHQLLIQFHIIIRHLRYQLMNLLLLVAYFLGLGHVEDAAVDNLMIQCPLIRSERHGTAETVDPFFAWGRLISKQLIVWNVDEICEVVGIHEEALVVLYMLIIIIRYQMLILSVVSHVVVDVLLLVAIRILILIPSLRLINRCIIILLITLCNRNAAVEAGVDFGFDVAR